MTKINVTKAYLPPIGEYQKYIDKIWQTAYLTNQGPLVKELEERLESYLEISNLQFVSNGTIALQIALRALNITCGEIITTPFSYVATTSAILWERCRPVYVDIEPETFCIDADKIEAAITPETKAILAVHVFGFPCDVEKIESIAKKYNLKVIYDGAHAFGVKYKGKSLLGFGDITTCSFHATKIFQTIEGGAVITKDETLNDKLDVIKRFGHKGDIHTTLGINAKASEFQAAMGLCCINHIDEIIEKRKAVYGLYDMLLLSNLRGSGIRKDVEYNYSYYPVIFANEKQLLLVKKALEHREIYPRRYFYPSLNKLPYLDDGMKVHCPMSEDISARVLCLPLYPDLGEEDIKRICLIVNKVTTGEKV